MLPHFFFTVHVYPCSRVIRCSYVAKNAQNTTFQNRSFRKFCSYAHSAIGINRWLNVSTARLSHLYTSVILNTVRYSQDLKAVETTPKKLASF